MPGLFNDVLMDQESLFSYPESLDPDFLPKLLPHREDQQIYVAECIKPLTNGRTGRNLFVTGSPGIGKTACMRHVLRDLEEETDVPAVMVNCWKKNSSFKILAEIASALGFKFTMNLGTDEVMQKIVRLVGDRGIVLIFDEVDKATEQDFLYHVLEDLPKKAVILVTNDREWLARLDGRIKSRLLPDTVEFEPYNEKETYDILRVRRDYAFYENVWDDDAFDTVVEKTVSLKDIRTGIFMLRESGLAAERDASRRIKAKHAQKAVEKADEFKITNEGTLSDEEKLILALVKQKSGAVTGDLFKEYEKTGGDKTSRTFERRLKSLEEKGLIELRPTGDGFKGRSTIIVYKGF